jgi:hypothetical protein
MKLGPLSSSYQSLPAVKDTIDILFIIQMQEIGGRSLHGQDFSSWRGGNAGRGGGGWLRKMGGESSEGNSRIWFKWISFI